MPLFRVIIRCILLFNAKVYMIFRFQDKVRTAQLPAPAEFMTNFADTYTVDNDCVIMPLKSFLHWIIFAIYR